MKIETTVGDLLLEVCLRAVDVADEHKETVTFDFNGIEYAIHPWEPESSWRARVEQVTGFPLRTREQMAEDARGSIAKREQEEREAIAAARVPTEQELREATVPWPKTEEELTAYIRALVERPHDYGTCVYAMSMAATAAFYYVSGKLGVTGFQASCADMDVLRRTRGYKDGFRLVDYHDILYPQYWDEERTPIYQALLRDPEHRTKWADRAREEIAKAGSSVNASVLAHWQRLAAVPSPEGR